MVAELLIAGFCGGVLAGMFGVGGGVLFVPAMVIFASFTQITAEATSFVAIVPVAMLGSYRQHRYGNVRIREGLILGLLATGGTYIGVVIANALSGDQLRKLFGVLLLVLAAQLAYKNLRKPTESS